MSSTAHPHSGHAFVPSPDAPDWFIRNLQNPGTSRRVTVDSSDIHLLTWNWDDTTLPTLLFVHGFCGHAHWWSFLMPFFVDRYRLGVIDLPGMGDSSPHAQYNDESFARGIIGVVDACNLNRPTLIGHSFGGVQSIRALAMAPEAFSHGIIVDSYVPFTEQERPPLFDSRPPHKTQPTLADCIARFRLSPPQPEVMQPLMDFIAYHSFTGDKNGWRWKFDHNIQNYGELQGPELLHTVKTKIDCVYGELSGVSIGNRAQRIFEQFSNRGRLVMVPGAHHHQMLNQPLRMVEAIEQLL